MYKYHRRAQHVEGKMTKPTAILDYILDKSRKHNPTLRSFVRVEKLILENKEFETKRKLYSMLPKGMQYPSFNFVLDILEKQGKITFGKDGSFFWTGPASQKLERSMKKAKKF